jgi:hypothetical protein
MFLKRMTWTLIITLALTGFFFIAAPDQSRAGVAQINERCCQFAPDDCIDFSDLEPGQACNSANIVDNASCNEQTGMCVQQVAPIASPIPTLSEWGLIAMAGVLGIVGYIIIRRRRVSA